MAILHSQCDYHLIRTMLFQLQHDDSVKLRDGLRTNVLPVAVEFGDAEQ
jgi:hypothetical protein